MDHSKNHHSEEISLFELWGFIKKGFNRIGDSIFRFIAFLLRNAIILIVLIIVGTAIGYFIDKAMPKSLRTEAVVVAGFESSDYLYASVDAVNHKLEIKDSLFFEKMGLDAKEDYGFSLKIEPVLMMREINGDQENYFELLNDNDMLTEKDRQNLISKSNEQHKLVLYHYKKAPSKRFFNSLIEYFRENPHYQEVFQLMGKSLDHQIESNIYMLAQIDSLLTNYSKNMGTVSATTFSENKIELGNLLANRMQMQEETRKLQQQRIESQGFLKVISMNAGQALEDTSIFDKKTIAYPLILLGLFFLVHVLIRIYRKSKEKMSQLKNPEK